MVQNFSRNAWLSIKQKHKDFLTVHCQKTYLTGLKTSVTVLEKLTVSIRLFRHAWRKTQLQCLVNIQIGWGKLFGVATRKTLVPIWCLPSLITERFWAKSGKSFQYKSGYISLIKSPRGSKYIVIYGKHFYGNKTTLFSCHPSRWASKFFFKDSISTGAIFPL